MKTADKLALGMSDHTAGKLQSAEAIYREILLSEPDHVDALHLLGVVLHQTKRSEQSVEFMRRAIALRPGFVEAHSNLGNILVEQGRPDRALAHFQCVVELQPNVGDAHYNLGVALSKQRRLDDAVACFRRALEIEPDSAKVHNKLGNALTDQGKLVEAIESYRIALEIDPNFSDAHNNLGCTFREQGEEDKALACYRRAVQITPEFAEAHNNLGAVLRDMGEIEQAAVHCQRAVQLNPQLADAHNNLGNAFDDAGQHDLAVASYERALQLRPDYAEAHNNLAMLRLLLGQFETGWTEYEWRLRTPTSKSRDFDKPRWDGSRSADKIVLIWSEQGLGDTLQFIRYVPLVRQRVGRVVVLCQKPVRPLLSTVAGIDSLITQEDRTPTVDFQIPMLSLPGVLGTNAATIPQDVPYLSVESTRVRYWQGALSELAGFRVGISWQGSPTYKRDRFRSIPLLHFEQLARVPGTRLISLQKGHGTEQIAQLNGVFEVLTLGTDFDSTSGPFIDTAAVMQNLDVFITSDTALAHVAGALGVRVWVILPWLPDWRWLLDREDSPWYPTMRLFRQQQRGDWGEVFQRVSAALDQLISDRCQDAGVLRMQLINLGIETPPGELLDRISILEIRGERAEVNQKPSSGWLELEQLRRTRDAVLPLSSELARLADELKRVNGSVCELQDQIAECEKRECFDARYIQQVLSVERANERRASLRRAIDRLLGARF